MALTTAQIDDMVAAIDLEDGPEDENYDEGNGEEWGEMADDSRNQDVGVTDVPEVNIQEALLRTEQQKKDLEMKNAKKLEKDRIVRISQKKRRIRYTPPGKYCKIMYFRSGSSNHSSCNICHLFNWPYVICIKY